MYGEPEPASAPFHRFVILAPDGSVNEVDPLVIAVEPTGIVTPALNPPDQPVVTASLAVPVRQLRQRRHDAQWLRMLADPWATRRLRGMSSGDRRVAKRPDLRPVEDSVGDLTDRQPAHVTV